MLQAYEQIGSGDFYVNRISVYSGTVTGPYEYICSKGMRIFDRFFYVSKGTIYISDKQGHTVEATAGSIIYLPDDFEYFSRWDEATEGRYLNLHFSLLDYEGNILHLSDKAIIVAKDQDGSLYNSFNDAYQLYIQHKNFDNLKLKSLFYTILYTILKQMDYAAYKSNKETAEIYKAMIYLNDNYMTDVTTEQLAEMCNLSPSTFRKLFKIQNGTSPHKYKNHLRMLHARKMLQSGLYNVSEVSDIVKCHDLSHFNKLYKKEFGVNPSDDILPD